MKSILITFVIFYAGAVVAEDCNVVPMVQWAGEASLRTQALSNPVGTVVIQHTVTPEPNTDQDCERILKAIRNYQRKLGFDDIAESFLVCGNGKVYEGAGWGLVGAHTKGYNNKAVAIAFIGEFGSHAPSPAAVAAAQELMACGVAGGHLGGQYKLVGHRQVSSTVSPGDALQKIIQTWPHFANTL